jgi:hypothetical protein
MLACMKAVKVFYENEKNVEIAKIQAYEEQAKVDFIQYTVGLQIEQITTEAEKKVIKAEEQVIKVEIKAVEQEDARLVDNNSLQINYEVVPVQVHADAQTTKVNRKRKYADVPVVSQVQPDVSQVQPDVFIEEHVDYRNDEILALVTRTYFRNYPWRIISQDKTWSVRISGADQNAVLACKLSLLLNASEYDHATVNVLQYDNTWLTTTITKPTQDTMHKIKNAIAKEYNELLKKGGTGVKDRFVAAAAAVVAFNESETFIKLVDTLTEKVGAMKLEGGSASPQFSALMNDFVKQYATALKQMRPEFKRISKKQGHDVAIKWLDENYKSHIHMGNRQFVSDPRFRTFRRSAHARVKECLCVKSVCAGQEVVKGKQSTTVSSATTFLCQYVRKIYSPKF